MFGHIFGPRNRQDSPEYFPLAHDVDDDEGLSKEARGKQPPSLDDVAPRQKKTQARGWAFFMTSCVISTILSAFNLSFLSVGQTLENISRANASARRTPSVYMGLEKVKWDRQLCRGRASFPKHFWTFKDGDMSTLQWIHAPDDKMSIAFGGDVSAQLEWYMPDFGLENCTIAAKFISDPFTSTTSNSTAHQIDVFILKKRGDLSDRTFLDTLTFAPGTESRTRPFHCPSRTKMYFEWDCKHPDCWIQFPLEGVTHMTASAQSLEKTGFRMMQHEALECIH